MYTEPAGRRNRVSDEIVERVANTKDVDQLELNPLYRAIDPDAIDKLWSGSFTGTVSFEYAECTVTVDGESGLEVRANAPSDRQLDQRPE